MQSCQSNEKSNNSGQSLTSSIHYVIPQDQFQANIKALNIEQKGAHIFAQQHEEEQLQGQSSRVHADQEGTYEFN